MTLAHFNLNDIDHEPSDEQLAALMEAVASEVRKRGETARAAYLEKLKAGLKEADLKPTKPHVG